MRRWICLAVALTVSAAPAGAYGAKPTSKIVDSGSFGVFIGGRRVATEKFEIQQRADMNVATTELLTEESGNKPTQSTELQLTLSGDLLRYTWHDLTGEKTETVVEPKDEFLIQHISSGPEHKPAEVPFLLPHSTTILDDFAFMHRELLAWRYMASVCSPSGADQMQCKTEKTQYGVLIPQERTSSSVYLTFVGKEKVTIRGTERELIRINISPDGTDWSLWLDDANKMIRATVSGLNTEILRD